MMLGINMPMYKSVKHHIRCIEKYALGHNRQKKKKKKKKER
jgi:hypothetical protein